MPARVFAALGEHLAGSGGCPCPGGLVVCAPALSTGAERAREARSVFSGNEALLRVPPHGYLYGGNGSTEDLFLSTSRRGIFLLLGCEQRPTRMGRGSLLPRAWWNAFQLSRLDGTDDQDRKSVV